MIISNKDGEIRGFNRNYEILNKLANFVEKSRFFMNFKNFSLSAKFNRFFIILGGSKRTEKTPFLVVLGVQKPGVSPSFFDDFRGPDIRADGTPYTVGRVKSWILR